MNQTPYLYTRPSFRCIFALLLLAATAGVHATPTNDDWANRTSITTLPFEIVMPMSGTTVDATDPVPGCQEQSSASTGTIWFGYTTGATAEILTLRIKDFQIPSVLAVYTGSPGAFRLAPGACARAGGSPNNAQLAGVQLAANTTYSILLSAQTSTAGWSVDFTVTAAHLYNVTKIDDTFDGTCDADCSLREAIQAANEAINGEAGAVIVPAGTYVLSRTGTNEDANSTGDLDILNDMGIYGAGMGQTIIDANGIDRVIDVVSGAQDVNTLILGDLTLTHGNASDTLGRGGGILNYRSLTPGFIGLERVALVDNHARQTGGGLDTASSGTVRESRFTLNNVSSGGGGGGALVFNPQNRPFEIESSTFDENDGGNNGGAIQTHGNLRLTNSTISGNHVAQNGGGIFVVNGPFVMSSTTVAFNKAGTPAFWNHGGGLFLESTFNYDLFNNIIASNTVDDCLIFSGTINSHHNHVQAPGQDTVACTFTGTGDVTGTDPLLDPLLANNGGPTPTHVLPFTSPAHDTGDPAGCNAPDGLPLVNDQRGAGFPRQDGRCDKGAYEQMVLFANGFEP